MTAAESRVEKGQEGKGAEEKSEWAVRNTSRAAGLLFSFSPFLLRTHEIGVDGLKSLERGDG
jgi:hypothetical protein